MSYRGPVVCIDAKPDNYLIAGDLRRSRGRRGLVIDPYRLVTEDGGECYNPLDTVSNADLLVPDRARDFANALVIRTGQEREPFFPNASEQLIQAVLAAVLSFARPDDRHLVNVANLIAGGPALEQTLKALQETGDDERAYAGVLNTLGRQAAQLQGKEKASVLASIAQYLGWLNSQPVRNTISRSSFDPLDIKRGVADLWIILPPDKLRSAAGFTRALLTGILRRIAEGSPDESNPVLVIIDEAAAAMQGHLAILEDAVNLFAGWGVKLLFVWQSIGQVYECFPGEKAKTFMTNMSLQIFGKTNDYDTAKLISERLGDATIHVRSHQEGGSRSWSASGKGEGQRSVSWGSTLSEHGRRLLKPEEVLVQPATVMTVFTDSTPPIRVEQVRYYEPHFWDFNRPTAGAAQAFVILLLCLLSSLLIAVTLLTAVGSLHPPGHRFVPNTSDQRHGPPVGGNHHCP